MNEIIKVAIDSYPKTSISLFQIISSMLTPIIGILTIYIAYQQWRTNKNKLKLDLYEKRRFVYLKLQDFLFAIIKNANIEPKISHKFKNEIAIDKYLFNKKEIVYLNEVYTHAIELWTINTRIFDDLGNPINMDKSEERKKDIEKKFEEIKWLTNQIPIIETKFSKYFIIR